MGFPSVVYARPIVTKKEKVCDVQKPVRLRARPCRICRRSGDRGVCFGGHQATGGTANLMIYGVNTDGAYWHAIVSGVIGDYGPAVSIYPDGQVDPAHTSQMVLRLTHGSFRLSIAALDKAFVKAGAHAPIYPKTCTDLISVTGTTPIVAGSGTGAYHGITGSFPVTLTLNEVEATPCQPNPGAFRAQLITVAGSGTISARSLRHSPASAHITGPRGLRSRDIPSPLTALDVPRSAQHAGQGPPNS
jgi:hypothetical protein